MGRDVISQILDPTIIGMGLLMMMIILMFYFYIYCVEDLTAFEHDDFFYILGASQLLMIYICVCVCVCVCVLVCVGRGP